MTAIDPFGRTAKAGQLAAAVATAPPKLMSSVAGLRGSLVDPGCCWTYRVGIRALELKDVP